MGKGKNIAYIRVSTIEQNEARQKAALQEYEIDRWFIEKASGRDANRPKLQEMLDYATYWVGKIDYASSQNNTDPHGESHEELHDGGRTDCSWFVYHVLFRYGLLNHFVHSYEWGNSPGEYPGGHNIGRDLSNAVPGDILCTGEGTKSQNSHVLIYLGGDKVVHCAAGHGVIISDAPNHPRQIVHFSCVPSHQTDKGVDTE